MQNNVLLEGLSTILTGFIVVYLGLIILIGAISLMRLFADKKADKPTKQPAPVKASYTDNQISPETVACIAAAVASIMQSESPQADFIVRSIRRH